MKQQTKHSNIFITLVLLVLAVFCVTSVTYSYFTAIASKDGDITFGDLNVRFIYREFDSNGNAGTATPGESGTISVYSADGPIQTGVEFKLSLSESGEAIHSLGIQNLEGSCPCFVRFWIDAYVVKNNVADTTTNFGKYFFLAESDQLVYTRENSSVTNSWCYFFTKALDASATSARSIGNTLELNDVSEEDKVPVELLGEKLQITISFEAVQATNNAYTYVFGDAEDTRGYYTGWSEIE